jgi:hypothetical protein
MLLRLTALLDRAYVALARFWIVTLFANLVVVFLIIFRLVGAQPDADDPTVLDLQLAFNTDRFVEVIQAWGPDVTDDFRANLWIDCLFPVVYSLALGSGIALLSARDLTARADDPPPYLVLLLFMLPFVAAFFDLAENAAHWLALDDPLHPPSALVLTASVAAVIKWALIGVSLLAVVLLLGWRSVERLRGAESAK